MSVPAAPVFTILNNQPVPPPIRDTEYLEAAIEVLADGSHAIDGVVRLEVFDREIWYDIYNHLVVKWRDGEMVGSSLQFPRAQACTGCEGDAEPAFEAPNAELQKRTVLGKGKDTADRFYDVREENNISVIELHVNDKCNFRCDYCYLKTSGIEYLDNEMPREVASQSVDLLVDSLPQRGTGVIKFFGGEPFLSYGLMKFVVAYGRQRAAEQSKSVEFTVNTNGALLNEERMQWIRENHVRVTISLDGNEASNDRFRTYERGGGTYKVVIKKAKQFLETLGYLNLRSTVTDGGFELKDSMLEFAEMGPKVKFMTDCNLVGPQHVTHADAEKLNEELSDLAKLWIERIKKGEKIMHGNLVDPMMRAFYSVKTPYRCGAARTLVGIGPTGKVYPCHRFIDVEAVEMGTVQDGLDGRQREEFIENRVEAKEPCNRCWARYFCGGGCAFNNFFTNANIRDTNSVHCKVFRHQVKLALYMYTELHRAHNERVSGVAR